MKLIKSVTEMEAISSRWNFDGKVALVPTMGYLHDGHMALVRKALEIADTVVVSIFVNPLQFAPTEDLATYPRDEARDLALLEEAGVDYVFIPSPADITPGTMTTTVDPGAMQNKLCGQYRPGHFVGVCTIVTKLFNVIRAGKAVFGWKDAQQFLILRKMVADLAVPVELIGVETGRADDGLALSSRNTYLNEIQRQVAPSIQRALQLLRQNYLVNPNVECTKLRDIFLKELQREPELSVQYIEIVSMESLEPVDRVVPDNTLIATAVFAGKTRLIDNIRL